MSEQADKNIERYTLHTSGLDNRNADRFCLISLEAYDSDDPEVRIKRDGLLELLADEFRMSDTAHTMECTMGNCDVQISVDGETHSRDVTGTCLAASYCLKEAFLDVKDDEGGVEEGKARYKILQETCEGRVGKESRGNFCPKLDCGLSAGVSVDGIPGTAGECVMEIRGSQPSLFEDRTYSDNIV